MKAMVFGKRNRIHVVIATTNKADITNDTEAIAVKPFMVHKSYIPSCHY